MHFWLFVFRKILGISNIEAFTVFCVCGYNYYDCIACKTWQTSYVLYASPFRLIIIIIHYNGQYYVINK